MHSDAMSIVENKDDSVLQLLTSRPLHRRPASVMRNRTPRSLVMWRTDKVRAPEVFDAISCKVLKAVPFYVPPDSRVLCSRTNQPSVDKLMQRPKIISHWRSTDSGPSGRFSSARDDSTVTKNTG